MSARRYILGIETSNPSACETRREPERDLGHGVVMAPVLLGPSVALGEFDLSGLEGSGPNWRSEAPCMIVGDEPVGAGDRHSDDLMPAIERLFARVGVRASELDSVAVSIGPGGYTGLRIAVTAAKTIAHAVGAGVIGVPTAMTAKWDNPVPDPALVCLAGKGDACWGALWEGVRTRGLGVIRAGDIGRLNVRTIVADEHLPGAMRVEAGARGIPIVAPRLSAAFVIGVARELRATTPDDLEPIYAREPDAVTQWRARRG